MLVWKYIQTLNNMYYFIEESQSESLCYSKNYPKYAQIWYANVNLNREYIWLCECMIIRLNGNRITVHLPADIRGLHVEQTCSYGSWNFLLT